MFEVLPDILAL